MKKNLRKSIAALFVIAALVLFRLLFFDGLLDQYNRQTKPADYRGLISLWDVSATTVMGSQYSFIQTVCEDFEKANYGILIDIYKIPEISAEETVGLGMASSSRPDVVRYKIGSYTADTQKLISDAELMNKLASEYASFVGNPYGDKLVVDLYCNISVIIVNTDILGDLGVQTPSDDWTKNDFIAFLASIEAADAKNKYRTIDFSKQNVNAYLPFLLGNTPDNADSAYLAEVIKYGQADMQTRSAAETSYDFYNKATAVYCGDLKTVNYLLRQQSRGKGFNFQAYLYPSDGEPFIYVNDIVSYAFLDSGDEGRNNILKSLAEYMLTYDALQYTENLGMLPCIPMDKIEYLKYPHLAKFKIKNASYYTIRDELIKKMIVDAPLFFK